MSASLIFFVGTALAAIFLFIAAAFLRDFVLRLFGRKTTNDH